MPKLHIFIVSWAGQHNKAILIANHLDGIFDKLTIVYSDPNPDFEFNFNGHLIRRPDSLFWSDKFKTCLDA